MGKRGEHVPAQPFADLLNRRVGEIAARHNGDPKAAGVLLAAECGWGHHRDQGVRKLYRFRNQLLPTSKRLAPAGRGHRKGDYLTDTFPRAAVEDALDHLGVPFAAVYPEIAAREEVVLERDAFCGVCGEVVTPIGGLCPWCEKRVGWPTGQVLAGERLDRRVAA